jgi:molybdopterin-guanine dinucleotide biosynthesis protein A
LQSLRNRRIERIKLAAIRPSRRINRGRTTLPMSIHPRPIGLILAGGRSLRMRGALPGEQSDKGLLELNGKPLLSHVIERLAPQSAQLILNANGDPARLANFNLPVVADTIEGFAGPLAGLLAGMQWTQANAPNTTHLVSVSTDVPFLPTNLVEKLQIARVQSHAVIALARSSGGLHPVIGLWPLALADDLEAALRDGTRKVQEWTRRHAAVPVDFPDLVLNGRAVDPFFNANTPTDLAQARELLGHEPPA